MVEHPGWWLDGTGCWRRLLLSPGAVWLAVATPRPDGGHEVALDLIEGEPGNEPDVDVVDPAELTTHGSRLGEELLAAGPVARIRTGELWEALVGAIFRCTMPLERARTVYRNAAKALGMGHDTPVGRDWVFPGPSMVLELEADVFDVCGLGEIRDRLRTAAWVARVLESRRLTVPWYQLATVLAPVPGIGALIAGAAVADLSGDFRLLPPTDFLVRRRVRALDPSAWPEGVVDFGARWQAMTGTERSTWTVLVLARQTAARTSCGDGGTADWTALC
ncbi:hypothetical protein CVV72_10990 [Amycolatopsis sp. TNS106]|nr:hypothetical protein CVV72_10990 [Amycolatopsis sp. TNS106]